jgi:hypothetical protein
VVSNGVVISEVVISQNLLSGLDSAAILALPGTFITDLDITGNLMTSVGQTIPVGLPTAAGVTSVLGGILLLGSGNTNVKICENVVESVGPALDVSLPGQTWILGIYVSVASGLRVAGNRVIDVAPLSPVTFGGGIRMDAVTGRADVVDNEVRRASTPPLNADPSPFGALSIIVVGDANIRGNTFEAFGDGPIILVQQARSCLFCNNECFLDNPPGTSLTTKVVQLGSPSATNGAIIASGNFVQIASSQDGVKASSIIELYPADSATALTVLGNITGGSIEVNGALLSEPWLSLNVVYG